MKTLFDLELYAAEIIKRPSAKCKTPYVADTKVNSQEAPILAHTPALGCCGLSDKGASVLVSKMPLPAHGSKKKPSVCSHRVELGLQNNTFIGLNPKLAERIVECCFQTQIIPNKRFVREKTILNSRFDFVGMDDSNIPFICEVKTAPLLQPDSTISYFPDGYRKKKGAPVSTRALKHLDDLIEVAKTSKTRAMMCYLVQRGDSTGFVPSDTDPIYKAKFYEAKEAGVEMWALQVSYVKKEENIVSCDFKTLYRL